MPHYTKKIDFEPIMATQLDFNQCTHDRIYKAGFSRSGKQRKICAFCNRVWCGDQSKEQVMEDIARCYKDRLSPIEAHYKTNHAIITIYWRYKQFYQIKPVNCLCGQPIIHQGKCDYRTLISLPTHRRKKQILTIQPNKNWFLDYLDQFKSKKTIEC